MSRTRSRKTRSTSTYRSSTGGPYVDISSEWISSQIDESTSPGSCNVSHFRKSGWTLTVSAKNGTDEARFINEPGPDFSAHVGSVVGSKINSLNWGKLPTSNEAGLIQILAELDDTVEMFALKWWKQLSYGKITWGLLPFISDLQACAKVVEGLSKDLAKFSYEDQLTVPIPSTDKVPPGSQCYGFRVLGGTAKVRKTGLGDLSFHHPGSIALDRLGVHPDLATVWDLVPLSFLVDYILPIGNWLEGFRQGGWVKTMIFKGWLTVKYDLDCEYYNEQTGYTGGSGPYKVSRFSRIYQNDILVVPPSNKLGLRAPSIMQIFNSLYVLAGSKTKLPF